MLAQRKGKLAELVALTYLRMQGMRLIAQNFSCKLGEIDLIMADRSRLQQHILVFVEVRYRQRKTHGGPAASVTEAKRTRIVRTAARYLQAHPQYRAWPSRFDVVALAGNLLTPQIDWLPRAFDA